MDAAGLHLFAGTYETGSVLSGRPFDVVDDQRVDRTFGGFQLEAQLLLDGAEDVRRLIGAVTQLTPLQEVIDNALRGRSYR